MTLGRNASVKELKESRKRKRSGAVAMTLKVKEPPLVLTTLNEEWEMQNISEMLNSKKEAQERNSH